MAAVNLDYPKGIDFSEDKDRTEGKDPHWPPRDHPGKKKDKPFDLLRTIPTHDLYEGDCPVTVLTREEWGALPAKSGELHDLPLTHVRFTDTDSETCRGRDECVPLLKRLQQEDMDKGLSDIKYNFMIGGDGTIYEGRGWYYEADRPDEEQGVLLTGIKGYSCDIAFIGTYDRSFTVDLPPQQSFSAFHFCHWASQNDLLGKMYTITQLRQPPSVAVPARRTI